jgi:hypothetical protein
MEEPSSKSKLQGFTGEIFTSLTWEQGMHGDRIDERLGTLMPGQWSTTGNRDYSYINAMLIVA